MNNWCNLLLKSTLGIGTPCSMLTSIIKFTTGLASIPLQQKNFTIWHSYMLPILQTQFDWQTGDQRLAFIQMLKKCDIKYVWYESQKAYLIRNQFRIPSLLFLKHLKCRMSIHDFDSLCITNIKTSPFLANYTCTLNRAYTV